MYYQWNGLFTGETYIKFQMASNDLAAYITNSTGLLEGKSDIFTPQHQHLPYPQERSEDLSGLNLDHEYFHNSRKVPDWFNPAITNRGRGYILDRGPNSQVFINEDTSTVYLKSVKG